MPNYPSNFISGTAPGVQSKNNPADKWELRIDSQSTFATPAAFTARVATTANITLQDEQTIDGVAVVAGNTVLVKNQGTASQNGLYLCVAGANNWTRVTGFDEAAEMLQNTVIAVTLGTVAAGKKFKLATDEPIVVGTTSLSFTEVSATFDILSAANYPTDVPVGVADITNQTDTLRDFATALNHVNQQITAYNTAYAALVALEDTQEGYDRSFIANMNSGKISRLKHQLLMEAYRMQRYTALINKIVTVHAPTYSATQGSRYPSGWNRGWTV
jgi:hypothetical protein